MSKVMLVEDDNNLREIYEARMQAEGYDVVTASDGEQALVVAKAEKPELIVSDVMMPKISGFEMLDILRNTEGLKDVKVIMLTALGQADDEQRADRLGADRYLVKSQVTLEDIVNVAHQLLGDNQAPAPMTAEPVQPVAEPVAPLPVVAPVAAPAIVPEPVVVPAPEPVVTPTLVTPTEPVPVVAAPPAPLTTFSAVQVEPPSAPIVAPEPIVSLPAEPPALVEPAQPVDDVQSSAQEEALVEAQIEQFVAGASSEAPATVAPESAMTLPPPTEPIAPAPIVETPAVASAVITSDTSVADTASNDQIIADAANALAGSASVVAETVAPPLPASEPVLAPLSPPVEPAAAAPAPAADGNPVIAGKKIISPIDSEVKPDINQLLAQQEAKDIAAGTALPVMPEIATPPSGEIKPDPSSIAL